MIKAIIFDLDGVIVDSMPLHWEAEKNTMRKFGISVTNEQLDSYTGISVLSKFANLLKENSSSIKPEEVLEYHMVEGWRYVYANLKPIRGVIDLIKAAHRNGLKLGLASGSPGAFIDYALDRFEVRGFFDAIVSADDVVHGKPNPEMFLKSAAALNVTPLQCLVIEDSPQGIRAANAAGMKCVAITTTHGKEELNGADRVVDSFGEVTVESLEEI